MQPLWLMASMVLCYTVLASQTKADSVGQLAKQSNSDFLLFFIQFSEVLSVVQCKWTWWRPNSPMRGLALFELADQHSSMFDENWDAVRKYCALLILNTITMCWEWDDYGIRRSDSPKFTQCSKSGQYAVMTLHFNECPNWTRIVYTQWLTYITVWGVNKYTRQHLVWKCQTKCH